MNVLTKAAVQGAACGFILVWSHGVGVLSAQVEVPEGTRVPVRLEEALSSATAQEGQPVKLSVAYDVKVNGTVVIPQGAPVRGTVVFAVPKRRMGRTGKLDFSIERVTTVDGTTIPVRYTVMRKVGGSYATQVGVITAGAAFAFLPAAPFLLLKKGKDAALPKDALCEVFTDETRTVKISGKPLEGIE